MCFFMYFMESYNACSKQVEVVCQEMLQTIESQLFTVVPGMFVQNRMVWTQICYSRRSMLEIIICSLAISPHCKSSIVVIYLFSYSMCKCDFRYLGHQASVTVNNICSLILSLYTVRSILRRRNIYIAVQWKFMRFKRSNNFNRVQNVSICGSPSAVIQNLG